jgi:hypothetical protein
MQVTSDESIGQCNPCIQTGCLLSSYLMPCCYVVTAKFACLLFYLETKFVGFVVKEFSVV